MARTFTTSFSYHGKTYTAVISQVDGTVHIYIPDESLHDILPGGRATYKPAEGFKSEGRKFSAAQDIILSVLASLEKKMEVGL